MSIRGNTLLNFAVLVLGPLIAAMSGLPASAAPIRVMSFNIRGDFDLEQATDSSEAWNSLTGTHRRDLVATTIREIDPDVFGVEEAFSHQLKDLERSLADYDFYGVGRDDGALAGESCALFYRRDRFRRVNEGTFWLSNKPDEVGSIYPGAACVRIASWVILADSLNNGRELLVLNTHWDHISELARQHGAEVIRERIGSLAEGRPVVVLGDLNVPEEARPCGRCGGQQRVRSGCRIATAKSSPSDRQSKRPITPSRETRRAQESTSSFTVTASRRSTLRSSAATSTAATRQITFP